MGRAYLFDNFDPASVFRRADQAAHARAKEHSVADGTGGRAGVDEEDAGRG